MALTDKQVHVITRAAILAPRLVEILSDFEVETLADISRRFLRHGQEAVVTDPEWQVFEDAVEAMSAALQRRVGRVDAVRTEAA